MVEKSKPPAQMESYEDKLRKSLPKGVNSPEEYKELQKRILAVGGVVGVGISATGMWKLDKSGVFSVVDFEHMVARPDGTIALRQPSECCISVMMLSNDIEIAKKVKVVLGNIPHVLEVTGAFRAAVVH